MENALLFAVVDGFSSIFLHFHLINLSFSMKKIKVIIAKGQKISKLFFSFQNFILFETRQSFLFGSPQTNTKNSQKFYINL